MADTEDTQQTVSEENQEKAEEQNTAEQVPGEEQPEQQVPNEGQMEEGNVEEEKKDEGVEGHQITEQGEQQSVEEPVSADGKENEESTPEQTEAEADKSVAGQCGENTVQDDIQQQQQTGEAEQEEQPVSATEEVENAGKGEGEQTGETQGEQVGEQEIGEQEIGEQELGEQEIGEQEIGEQEIGEQETVDDVEGSEEGQTFDTGSKGQQQEDESNVRTEEVSQEEAEEQVPADMSEEDKTRCQQYFNRKAVDGRLDLKGFKILYRLMGQTMTSEEAENTFEGGEKDANGTIDFDEFCRLYAKTCEAEQQRQAAMAASLEKIFPGMEGDEVDLKKVEGLLMKLQKPDLGMHLTREKSDLCANDIRFMVNKLDKNNTGKIAKTDLVNQLCQHLDLDGC